MASEGYKGKKHGSFAIREGWLTKGILAVKQKTDVFSKQNNYGSDILGVGSAMAKAIRYWMKSAGLIEDIKMIGSVLTPFGELVCKNDPYFEKMSTLWTVHYNIVANEKGATFWHLFFHKVGSGEYSRKDLYDRMFEQVASYHGGDDFPEKSYASDFDVFMRMYSRERRIDYDPEDKMDSPFAKLGLVTKTVRGYRKETVEFGKLDALVVLFAIRCCTTEDKVSIDDLLEGKGSPGKVLSLNRILLNDYLDILDERGYIRVDRTAGLDQVYLEKIPNKIEILTKYY